MKIFLLSIGKTTEKYLLEGIEKYTEKLEHYIPFQCEFLPDLKNTKGFGPEKFKEKESEELAKKIEAGDFVVLLDEKGRELSSPGFSQFLQQQMNRGVKRVVFIIGGAYGVSEAIKKRADFTLSLSMMTFPHQMARLIFAEQLYRAFTILKQEKYHHE